MICGLDYGAGVLTLAVMALEYRSCPAHCGSAQFRRTLFAKQIALEHVRPVVLEVGILLARELADAYAGVNTPRVEELVSNFWDNDQFLAA